MRNFNTQMRNVCTIAVSAFVLSALSCTSPVGATGKVTLTPSEPTLSLGGTQVFTATVEGLEEQAVIWSVEEMNGGAIDAAGLYTAPKLAGAYTVRASAAANPRVYALARVTVSGTPVIRLTPPKTTIKTATTVVFSAEVLGLSNTNVVWSIVEPAGGVITPAGVYVAPKVEGTYHVRATSTAQPEVFAEAAIGVQRDSPLTLSPRWAVVRLGGTLQFKTLSWLDDNDRPTFAAPANAGTVDAQGLYTPPSKPGTYFVTASSAIDPSAIATARVDVFGPPKAVSGTFTYVGAGKGKMFVTVEGPGMEFGTVVDKAGAYRVSGLETHGRYRLYAWLDVLGTNYAGHARNPEFSGDFEFNGEDVTLNGELKASTDLEVSSDFLPALDFVAVTSNAAYVSWSHARNADYAAVADWYTIYWGADADVGPGNSVGSRKVPAVQTDHRQVITGLPNNQALYFTIAATTNGIETLAAEALGPYTVGAPTSGSTVTGSVQLNGVDTSGADVWAIAETTLNDGDGTAGDAATGGAIARINPAQANPTYTFKGLDDLKYEVMIFIDRNRDGQMTYGKDRRSSPRNRRYIRLDQAPTSNGPTVSMANVDGAVELSVKETWENETASSTLVVRPLDGNKTLERLVLVSGPQVLGRFELFNQNHFQSKAYLDVFSDLFEQTFDLGSVAITPGAAYEFELHFSDGTTAMKTVQVPALAPRPTLIAPGRYSSIKPTFSWSLPSPAATLKLEVYASPVAWETKLDPTITSATFNQDETADEDSLPLGVAYWSMITTNENGSRCSVNREFKVVKTEQ